MNLSGSANAKVAFGGTGQLRSYWALVQGQSRLEKFSTCGNLEYLWPSLAMLYIIGPAPKQGKGDGG